jgi:ABC-type branched-subunit amino acid transport system substrate-binding protein/DNA-binding SARP family transcriptional activator
VDFRILGPLEVERPDGTASLGGHRQQSLLALLILHRNEIVPTVRLIDELWGDAPPATAQKTVQVYVSRLRRELGEERIETHGRGYTLRLAGTELDLTRFEQLVARSESEDAVRAAATLRTALSLYRGQPLGDLCHESWALSYVATIEELRLDAVERRVDADLACGRHRALVSELEALVRTYPQRERIRGQLMVALYRSGRQTDALESYRQGRLILHDQLGLEPGPKLRELEQRILRQDPSLNAASEPVRVSTHRRRGLMLAVAGAGLLLASAVAAAVAVAWADRSRATAGLPAGTWTIGVDVPLAGPAGDIGRSVRDAVRLEIHDANADGGILGSRLRSRVYNDAGKPGRFGQSPARGAADARHMVADRRTVAMIGPVSSDVAEAQIPITNSSGLLQCSPANTRPGLTKPRDGALDLRLTHPTRINYVRLAPSDDIQAPALAWYALHDLHARRALVIDDAGRGREIADEFDRAYRRLGGRTIRRALNPGADPTQLLPASAVRALDVVFFGGYEDGGAQLRLAMEKMGLRRVPLISWDGLLGGNGAVQGSFIRQAGAAAPGTFISHASIAPNTASFSQRYHATYGSDPDEYAAAAYSCAQVIVAALRAVAAHGTTAAGIRESLRAYAVDPKHRYETTIGQVGFDHNGDSTQQFVTFYRVDPSAANGAGDWAPFKQENFGPAP